MRILPILCLLAVAILVPPAAAAPPPLTADFTIAPDAPRPGEPVTFTSTSLAPAGGFIATDWDLDGDGDFDDERKPIAVRTFPAGPHTVRLRATLAGPTPRTDIATKTFTVAEPTATPTPTPSPEPTASPTPAPAPPVTLPTRDPRCVSTVRKDLFTATGDCLRRTHVDGGDGTKVRRPDGKLTDGAGLTGDQYRSSGPVTVNGIELVPAAGSEVIVNVFDGHDVRVGTRNGTATIRRAGEAVVVDDGVISWTVKDGSLENVVLPAVQKVGGLPIVAMPKAPKLVLGNGAVFGFTLRMPQQFGAPTSDKPVEFRVGGLRASASAVGAFHFEIADAVLGPIELNKLVLDYDGNQSWFIKADAHLPEPIAARLKADATIRDGSFESAGADLTFDDPGLSIVGPVFLKRIAFRVEFSPKQSECVPHVGVVDRSAGAGGIVFPAGLSGKKDYGVPTFALCGEVGLNAGGSILGTPVIGLDAGLGFAMFDDRPSVLRAFGEVSLVGLPLYEGAFEMHSDGYIELDAAAKWVWPGVAVMHGRLGVEMLGTKFNAHGKVEACVEVIDWCAASARAVASNAGVAVCLDIGGWEPGLGYRWGSTPTIYFAGCELGPYKTRIEHARASQVGARTLTLPAGLPGTAIAVVGRDRAPDVTLVGPHGERLTGTGRVGNALIVKSDREKVTQFAIARPSAGTWRIETADVVEKVMSADGLDAPRVKATVKGGKLRYSVEARPGQKVSFAERGASAGSIIGVARGRRGTLAFDPAAGKAERRTIVAIVEQDGMPSTQVPVTTFRAPKATRPGRVRGLRLTRAGSRLTVTWRRNAPAYNVTVALSDGRRIVRRVNGRTRLTLTGIPRALRAKATVRAVARNGMLGT